MDNTSQIKKKSFKKFLLLKVVVLLAVVTLFGINSVKFAKRVIYANNKKEEAYKRLTDLKQRAGSIEDKLDKLNSSYSQDEVLKNEMGQADPDEHSIIFVKPK